MKTKMRFRMYLLSMVLAIFIMVQSSLAATTAQFPSNPTKDYNQHGHYMDLNGDMLIYGDTFTNEAFLFKLTKDTNGNWQEVWQDPKLFTEIDAAIAFSWLSEDANGDYIAVGFAGVSGGYKRLRIWRISPDGQNSTCLYEPTDIDGTFNEGLIDGNILYSIGQANISGKGVDWIYFEFNLNTDTVLARRTFGNNGNDIGRRILSHPDYPGRLFLGGSVSIQYNSEWNKDGFVMRIDSAQNRSTDLLPLTTEWIRALEDFSGYGSGYNEDLYGLSISPNGVAASGWVDNLSPPLGVSTDDIWFVDLNGSNGTVISESKKVVYPSVYPIDTMEAVRDMVPLMNAGVQVGYILAVQVGSGLKDGLALFLDLDGDEIGAEVVGVTNINEDFRSVSQFQNSRPRANNLLNLLDRDENIA